MDFKNIIIAVVAVVNLGLGFFVSFKTGRNKTNSYFSLITYAVAFWSVSMIGYRFVGTVELSILWTRILYLSAVFIPLFLLYFSYLFLYGTSSLNFVMRVLILLPAIAVALISVWPNVLIKDVLLPHGKEKEIIFASIPYTFYFLYIVGYFSWAYFLLLKNFVYSSGIRRAQIRYIFIGTFSSGVLGMSTNLILPTLHIFALNWLGQTLTIVFVTSIAYAITRHHLLNIRVITTELFTFAIWIFLLVRTILSNTLQDLLVNGSLFIAVVIFGILLIRSVIREVEQREELERLNKEIERAYGVEKKARAGLEKLGEAKNQFIMATQHHLRTPLTAMMGYIDLLLTGSYGKISKKVRETLFKLQISTNRLIRTVNEILDISQFQLGKEVVQLKDDVDSGTILQEMYEELEMEAKTKGIYLKLEKPAQPLPKIKADPEKLKMALYNVADNAIKYTNKGGVTLGAKVTDSKLQIAIKDTGMGISKEKLPTIFGRLFERSKGAQKAFTTGRGIGMYITYQIIKAHKGKIWAESEGEGKGSTFFIELPIN